MQRFTIQEAAKHIGEKVRVSGWADTIRAHGKVLFVDLRDRSGFIQLVFIPSNKEIYEVAQKLGSEWVIEVEGQIVKRPENMQNPKMETGTVELVAEKITILSESKTLPISINTDGKEISEEMRMKYRYVDLRRQRMKDNIIMRHRIVKFIRDFLDKESFIEIETPNLTKSTPEGARDYIVPSRIQPGNFYALPQSPQQYKQLLMVAGLEKYFQIARCFRDEDSRGDRQPEFTQLDMEMSFVEMSDVMDVTERLLISIINNLFPEKKIQEIPFPKIDYKTAMEKYGTDRPDIRSDKNDKNTLAFCWVIDFPFFEKNDDGKWTFTHNPFSASKEEFHNDLMQKKNIDKILTTQYDVVLNGWEVGGGSIRNHTPEALEKVFEIMGYEKHEIKEKFGHILTAFSFGAPPHGGIAWGLDRFITLMLDEPNIREVMAFPKTGDGRDLMMQAPSEVSEKQLKELGISVTKKSVKKKNEK